MYRVTYSFYGKYFKEKTFETHEAAKRFFYGYCVKKKGITKAELVVLT
jgi:hypothetical protein